MGFLKPKTPKMPEMPETPKPPPPKLGPLPPTSASARPDGSQFSSQRSFEMPGVATSSLGLINPNLLKRNTGGGTPVRQYIGGQA